MEKTLEDVLRLESKKDSYYRMTENRIEDWYQDDYFPRLMESLDSDELAPYLCGEGEDAFVNEEKIRKEFYDYAFHMMVESDFREFLDTIKKENLRYPSYKSFIREFGKKERHIIQRIAKENSLNEKTLYMDMMVAKRGEIEPLYESEIDWEKYLDKYGFERYDRYVFFRWIKHHGKAIRKSISRNGKKGIR